MKIQWEVGDRAYVEDNINAPHDLGAEMVYIEEVKGSQCRVSIPFESGGRSYWLDNKWLGLNVW